MSYRWFITTITTKHQILMDGNRTTTNKKKIEWIALAIKYKKKDEWRWIDMNRVYSLYISWQLLATNNYFSSLQRYNKSFSHPILFILELFFLVSYKCVLREKKRERELARYYNSIKVKWMVENQMEKNDKKNRQTTTKAYRPIRHQTSIIDSIP